MTCPSGLTIGGGLGSALGRRNVVAGLDVGGTGETVGPVGDDVVDRNVQVVIDDGAEGFAVANLVEDAGLDGLANQRDKDLQANGDQACIVDLGIVEQDVLDGGPAGFSNVPEGIAWPNRCRGRTVPSDRSAR